MEESRTRKKQAPTQQTANWLMELWPDGDFEFPDKHVPRGSYCLDCTLVRRHRRLFLLKRYNPEMNEGIIAEINNYRRYGQHPAFPTLEAILPVSAEAQGIAYGAILITYFEREFREGPLLEVLAACLNLATIFMYFDFDNRIYFDLRLDSLRLDDEGGLRIIDFTDLISPTELHERGHGLPVVDRVSPLIPPEGLRYQESYDYFARTNLDWGNVRRSAMKLKPEPYHTYSLAQLILWLLGGRTLKSERVREALAVSEKDNCFTQARELVKMMRRMLYRGAGRRLPLDEVRAALWNMLKPCLADKGAPRSGPVADARNRLRTLTRSEGDPVSLAVHETLQDFWRSDSECPSSQIQ